MNQYLLLLISEWESKTEEKIENSLNYDELSVEEKRAVDEFNEKIDVLKEGMDKLDAAFEEIKIPSTSVPMVLYSCYRITKDKKSFTKLVEIINEFLNCYDDNEEYKQFVQSGTGSQQNVRGRFDWWREKIRTAQIIIYESHIAWLFIMQTYVLQISTKSIDNICIYFLLFIFL